MKKICKHRDTEIEKGRTEERIVEEKPYLFLIEEGSCKKCKAKLKFIWLSVGCKINGKYDEHG